VKYLFSFIFFINLLFYLFLIFVPINQSYVFSISQGDNLNKIFKNLEDKDIYFPRVLKIMMNIFDIDKKLSQGSYEIISNDSLFKIFKKLEDSQIILKKFIIKEGSSSKELFSQEIVNILCEKKKINGLEKS